MKIKILISTLIITVTLSLGFNFAYAQQSQGGGTTPVSQGGGTTPTQTIPALQNPLQATSITAILTSLADIAIFIGAILAVLMFIFIGFKFVMARGNESKLKEAKEWFLYAAIGTAILISSKVIVEVVKQTFISAGVVNSSLFNQPQ